MELHNPISLILLVLVLPASWLMLRRRGRASLKYSSTKLLTVKGIKHKGIGYYGKYLLLLCRMACIVLLVLAISRPLKGKKVSLTSTKGVVMQIVLDRSSSMEEQMNYFGKALSRFETAKAVLKDFIMGDDELSGRPNDLLGLISFARYADTNCPLVQSPEILCDFLSEIQMARTEAEDGTALSDAIALAAARLNKAEAEIDQRNEKLADIAKKEGKESQPEFQIASKIIILLTDGIQNRGEYSPEEAVEMAKKWGIKIYSIGIGGRLSSGNSVFDLLNGPGFDEKLLKWMASETGGEYCRADNAEELKQMCEKIDKLEKSEIQSLSYNEYDEKYHIFAEVALAVLLLEILLSSTIFRRMP